MNSCLEDIFKIAEDKGPQDKVKKELIYHSEGKKPLGRELEITIHQKYVPDDEPLREGGDKSESLLFVIVPKIIRLYK